MLRRILIDQMLCEDENISINAAIIFDVVIKLMTHSQIQKINYNDKIYTVLYRNMILKQISHFKISTRTLSNAIKELEDAGLIECICKNTTPAYITTSKADGYNFLPKKEFLNIDDNKPQKQQLISLGKKTRLDKTTKEYKKQLQIKAKEHSLRNNISFEDAFQAFIDYHTSRGSLFVNWLSAYKTWVRNKIKFETKNKPNNGELYQ